MVDLETKRQIGIQLTDILAHHLSKMTPVIVIHDGEKIIDHGSGTFVLIEDTPVIVTAAHVIKNYADDMIHVVGDFTPTDYRKITPLKKEFMGGDDGDLLDIAYLIFPNEIVDRFGIDSFSNSKMIGVGTTWDKSAGTIQANRIEAVVHLLSLRFPSLEQLLECPTSGC
jgi:hypothetical protein